MIRKILIITGALVVGAVMFSAGMVQARDLGEVLGDYRTGEWNLLNSMQKGVELAIDNGVAANTVVLLLMLPLLATLVSVLHYVIGLSGYGIFMPTMIALVFLATGIPEGLLMFALILGISLLSNYFLKRFKLHFWPSRSINLMLISLGTLGLMMAGSYLTFIDVRKISIFPVLFMILLSEEFVRTQLVKSRSEAKKLMIGTLVLAIFGALLMNIQEFQLWVLRHPGMSLGIGLLLNMVVGSYKGIRWTEIARFKKAIRRKS